MHQYAAYDGNNCAVGCIGKHHTEEEHVEKRHDRRRIKLAFRGESVRFNHAFHIRGKRIIFQDHRSFLVLSEILNVHHTVILF